MKVCIMPELYHQHSLLGLMTPQTMSHVLLGPITNIISPGEGHSVQCHSIDKDTLVGLLLPYSMEDKEYWTCDRYVSGTPFIECDLTQHSLFGTTNNSSQSILVRIIKDLFLPTVLSMLGSNDFHQVFSVDITSQIKGYHYLYNFGNGMSPPTLTNYHSLFGPVDHVTLLYAT